MTLLRRSALSADRGRRSSLTIAYPRLTGAGLAIGFGCGIGLALHISLISVVLAAIVLPALTYAASIAPRLLMLITGSSARRPDFYQWKWGVTAWSVVVATITMFGTRSAAAIGLATCTLLSLYIAGKWGCYRAGCCGCVPHRVVNITASLPATEARITAIVLSLVVVCLVFGPFADATFAGLSGHLAIRAFAYWCRGERLIVGDLKRTPDLPALLVVLVLQTIIRPET